MMNETRTDAEFYELLPCFSVNPYAARPSDVSRMAAELMDARRQRASDYGADGEPLPVDEAWLRKVGFLQNEDRTYSVLLRPVVDGQQIAELFLWPFEDEWTVALAQDSSRHYRDDWVILTSFDNPTRPQLRRLIAALKGD